MHYPLFFERWALMVPYVTAVECCISQTAVWRFQKRNRHLDPEATKPVVAGLRMNERGCVAALAPWGLL